jgi:fatty acid desaturase
MTPTGLTPAQAAAHAAAIQQAQIQMVGSGYINTPYTFAAPAKVKPVMPAPTELERGASLVVLITGAAGWAVALLLLVLWDWSLRVDLVLLWPVLTSVAAWFVRRHELHERKRQYMADMLAYNAP